MCGIAGLLDPNASTGTATLHSRAQAMGRTLRHRGPDDEGVWVDEEAGVALASRRLAIVDLSAAGHQPMVSGSGRFVLVFNGEVYDHRQLRARLEATGVRFCGHSDTEVLLAAIEAWGLRTALERSNAMFALALWDRRERRLTLARDRLGEKPLYHGWAGGDVVFGSELKALSAHGGFCADIDRDSLAAYLRYSFVPHPRTIYRGVATLPPGSMTTFGPGMPPGTLPEVHTWWALGDTVAAGAGARLGAVPGDAVDQLDELLGDAVALRLEADVPVGAFLSGGIDSSTVVGLAQARGHGRVRTFTVAMPDVGFDEASDAREVARHLGTEHTEIALSAVDALAVVPRLATIYDEPLGDPSALPTVLVSEAASTFATVCLSGDGGDEVFGGYNRHVLGPRLWRRLGPLPRPARSALSAGVLHVPAGWWDAAGRALPRRLRVRNPGDKAAKLARLLACRDAAALYLGLVSQWDDPAGVVLRSTEPPTVATRPESWPPLHGTLEEFLWLDTAMVLPDNMLAKVDRASMAASLELRVPLLDHRLVEWAWRLPTASKVHEGKGKWLLRRVLDRYVPAPLVDRPKMGFDPPLGTWLRGPLRPWAEELLAAARLARDGWFETGQVRARWTEHLSGRRNHDYELWSVLMFQSWLDAR
ncbi:MAG: asparagine synthase (glutamine-hydrolyzing) [Acidimicrobiales bacterium]